MTGRTLVWLPGRHLRPVNLRVFVLQTFLRPANFCAARENKICIFHNAPRFGLGQPELHNKGAPTDRLTILAEMIAK